jgi:hypothetical protein
MAKARRAKKADPVSEAAVEYFAARSHDTWRKNLLRTNPEEKGKPRMRRRGGTMVDVNQPWSKLHPKAQAENKRAARDAYAALKKFPNDREAASSYIHDCWIERNKNDKSQPRALFKPYAQLPEVEKAKDRVHYDVMKEALAAARKRPSKKAAPKKAAALQVDAKSKRRLETAAKELSRALGREVSAGALLAASVEAVAALCKSIAAEARGKKG